MASTHSRYPIFKSPCIKDLSKYNAEDIQNWFKVLSLSEIPKTIPKGWYSKKDLAKMSGLAFKTIENHLLKAKKENKILVKNFLMKIGNVYRNIPHYFIKNKKDVFLEKN